MYPRHNGSYPNYQPFGYQQQQQQQQQQHHRQHQAAAAAQHHHHRQTPGLGSQNGYPDLHHQQLLQQQQMLEMQHFQQLQQQQQQQQQRHHTHHPSQHMMNQLDMIHLQQQQQHMMTQLVQQELLLQKEQEKQDRHFQPRPVTPQSTPTHPRAPDPLAHMRMMEQQQQQQQHRLQAAAAPPPPRPSVISAPRPSVLSGSLLENNPFMSWAKPQQATPPVPPPQPQPPPLPKPPKEEPPQHHEPVRVIAPSLLREREKKRQREEAKKLKKSASRPPVIKPPPLSTTQTPPAPIIPPFELPGHATAGLTGPIYRAEELTKQRKQMDETALFNQAFSRHHQGRDSSVDEWIMSILRSNQPMPQGRPDVIRVNDQAVGSSKPQSNKSVAETYPLLAQAISKCKEEIWLPKSLLQNESLTNPANLQLQSSHHQTPKPPPPPIQHNQPTAVINSKPSPPPTVKHEPKSEPTVVPAKRAASPLANGGAERKRSKSTNHETNQKTADASQSEAANNRKLSLDSQMRRGRPDKRLDLKSVETTVKEQPSLPEESKMDRSVADYDSDESSSAKPTKLKRGRQKRQETRDQKVMKLINRITNNGDLPTNVKKLSCKASAGETLLHAAARRGYESNLAYYLQMGLSVDAADNAGFTPLHEAVTKGHYNCVKLLLEQGSNPNVQSSDGTRPIHDVAENGDDQILRLLLSFGADPTLTTYSGETPLELAEDCQPTKSLLKEYLGFMESTTTDDVLHYPGEPRDLDIYGEDSFGQVPSSGEDEFEIEISDDPMPDSYWLTIGDTADNYVLLRDVTSKYAQHGLHVHSVSFQEFSKQVSSSGYVRMPTLPELEPEAEVELVRLDAQFRNLIGSKVWNSSMRDTESYN